MKLNELYIAPEAELISLRAVERLAWEEFGNDGISNTETDENNGDED